MKVSNERLDEMYVGSSNLNRSRGFKVNFVLIDPLDESIGSDRLSERDTFVQFSKRSSIQLTIHTKRINRKFKSVYKCLKSVFF